MVWSHRLPALLPVQLFYAVDYPTTNQSRKVGLCIVLSHGIVLTVRGLASWGSQANTVATVALHPHYGVASGCGIGLILIAYGATEVNPVGLLILLSAVTMGGLNQVIIQSQLQRDGAKYLIRPATKGSDSLDAGRPHNSVAEAEINRGNDGRSKTQLKLNPIVFT